MSPTSATSAMPTPASPTSRRRRVRRPLAQAAVALMAVAGIGVASGGVASADPFPAQNAMACSNVGGTYVVVDPPPPPTVATCTVVAGPYSETTKTAGQSGRGFTRYTQTTTVYTLSHTPPGSPVESTQVTPMSWCTNPGGQTVPAFIPPCQP
jgi:hypothetical protein